MSLGTGMEMMTRMFTRRLLMDKTRFVEHFLPLRKHWFCDATSSVDMLPTPDISEKRKKRTEVSFARREEAQNLLETRLRNPAITTLSELVKYSPDLQKLVSLGVSLRDVEECEGAPDLLANLKFYPDIDDIITLLTQVGVEGIGDIITRCPLVLGEGADNLKLKLIYLSSRKFTRNQIAEIVTSQPKLLLESVTEIDARLGAIQHIFKLSNADVREVVSRGPKIVFVEPLILQRTRLILEASYDFDEKHIKRLVIGCPAVLRTGEKVLRDRMDYILEVMGLNIEQILSWPLILRCRGRRIKDRHSVLNHLKMAEYDSTKPRYISLQRLVSKSDAEFCEHVAKIPLQLYYDYLKTF